MSTANLIYSMWNSLVKMEGVSASYYRETTRGTVDTGYPLSIAIVWMYKSDNPGEQVKQGQNDSVKKEMRKARASKSEIPEPEINEDYLKIGDDYWCITGAVHDVGEMVVLELTKIDEYRKGKTRILR